LDVRTEEEIRLYGKIDTARLLPHTDIEEALLLSEEDWLAKYKFPKIYKDQQICVYCRSQRRSNIAARVLKQRGFNRIVCLREGVIGYAYVDKTKRVKAYDNYEVGKDAPPQAYNIEPIAIAKPNINVKKDIDTSAVNLALA